MGLCSAGRLSIISQCSIFDNREFSVSHSHGASHFHSVLGIEGVRISRGHAKRFNRDHLFRYKVSLPRHGGGKLALLRKLDSILDGAARKALAKIYNRKMAAFQRAEGNPLLTKKAFRQVSLGRPRWISLHE